MSGRYNRCKFPGTSDGQQDPDDIMGSFLPFLPRNYICIYAWLLHHICQGHPTAELCYWFYFYLQYSGLIFHEYPGVKNSTDKAALRFCNAFHTLPGAPNGTKPIGVNSKGNRLFHDTLLTGIGRLGLMLGMRPEHLQFIKADFRGYFKAGALGSHPDGRNKLCHVLSRLRILLGFGAEKEIRLRLMEFNLMKDADAITFKNGDKKAVPTLSFLCQAGMSIYAMTDFGNGALALGESDNGDGTLFFAEHEVVTVPDANLTMVIDLWFRSHEETLHALNEIRTKAFGLKCTDVDKDILELMKGVTIQFVGEEDEVIDLTSS